LCFNPAVETMNASLRSFMKKRVEIWRGTGGSATDHGFHALPVSVLIFSSADDRPCASSLCPLSFVHRRPGTKGTIGIGSLEIIVRFSPILDIAQLTTNGSFRQKIAIAQRTVAPTIHQMPLSRDVITQ
jgi:hypothetical protein